MHVRIFFTAYVLFALTSLAFAQVENDEIKPNTIIYIYPQHLFINGIRGDIEFNEAQSKLRIVIGGLYYNRTVNKEGDMVKTSSTSQYFGELRNDKALSYGINFGLKWLINTREAFRGEEIINQFFGADLQYRTHTIKYNDFDYLPRVIDGITFYSYELTEFKGSTTQFGIAGYYAYEALYKHISINLKAGLAYYTATQSEASKQHRDFSAEGFLSPAYSGFAPYGLIGFGYRLE